MVSQIARQLSIAFTELVVAKRSEHSKENKVKTEQQLSQQQRQQQQPPIVSQWLKPSFEEKIFRIPEASLIMYSMQKGNG